MSEQRDNGDAAPPAENEQPARPRVVRRSRAEGQQRRAEREKERQKASWSNIVNASRTGQREGSDRPGRTGRPDGSKRGGSASRDRRSDSGASSRGGSRGSGPVRGGWAGGPARRSGGGPERRGHSRGGDGARGKRRAPIDPEKEARRVKATELAEAKGIPLAHAHRIVQGRTTLNDVLKLMMRQEKFERLVQNDGLDPSLAGQVASGHLSKERALVVSRIRKARRYPLDHDALKVAELEAQPVLIDLFGRGWTLGVVKAARVYDFDFQLSDAAEPELVQKHDVKAVAAESALESIESVRGHDETISSEGLAATAERSERVRPTDQELLALMEADVDLTLYLRDGETLCGRVVSFGRWDVTLALADGQEEPETATVLFHALHKKSLGK